MASAGAISIHAPRMGRDAVALFAPGLQRAISIHAPRMGRDRLYCMTKTVDKLFQSTRPVWGATFSRSRCSRRRRYFNPRAPYGARPAASFAAVTARSISIHAPRMGRDCFLCLRYRQLYISIHAPRMGRDT